MLITMNYYEIYFNYTEILLSDRVAVDDENYLMIPLNRCLLLVDCGSVTIHQ